KEHGAPPHGDANLSSADHSEDFATALFEGLQENAVDFVVGLPSSGLSAAQALCMKAQSMRYVAVAHEGTGLGLCAGAWLGGKQFRAVCRRLPPAAGSLQLRNSDLDRR